jgi:hypothetical protein
MGTYKNKTEKEIESMKRFIIPIKIEFETIKKYIKKWKKEFLTRR